MFAVTDQSMPFKQAVILSYQMSGSIVLRCPAMVCFPGRPAKVLLCSRKTACQRLVDTASGSKEEGSDR
jgi:hypothetical protein